MNEIKIIMTDESILDLLKLCAKEIKSPTQVISEVIRRAAKEAGISEEK